MSESQFEEVATGQFRYEDGEMVLSDPDPPSDSKPEEGLSGSRKSRRKQTFERRNIKKVREDALSEEAKAAQKAEMERRKRLLAKDGPDQADFSNIEFLLNGDGSSAIEVSDIELEGNELPTKRPKLEDNESEESEALPFDIHLQPIKNEEPTKDDKTYDDSSHHSDVGSTDSLSFHTENEKTVTAVPTASAALFGSKYTSNWSSHAGRTREDAILLGDSDDDDKAPDSVIEVSDGEEEPDEVETEICELRDAANLADSSGRIILNPTRSKEDEPEVALAPQIARVIKPHQVSGVRFLYDNLVENMERFQNTEGFGCILAHSMGLGKTIQIIGFLETIFRCCNAQRVLVIVPINTIQNWQAEFELWLPSGSSSDKPSESVSQKPGRGRPPANGRMDHPTESNKSPSSDSADNSHDYQPGGERPVTSSGHIKESDESDEDTQTNSQASEGSSPNKGSRAFKLFVVRDVVKTVSQRHQIICQWFKEGGVLLLGYEMFRLLLNQKRLGTNSTKAQMRAASKRKKKILCVDLEKEEKREQMLADFHTALLDPGPQLVICDEGHRIKNSEASISKALKAIRTRRRVVLTGYPLQNNLMEYWCMVDFVRPNYLGTKQEFTNMFQRPIENGQCIDSTPEDRKVMQGRAHVLHDLLSGFVQRRSHAVLKATLPPKTEVVLLIKLSSLQRTLYAAFMRSLNSSGPLGWVQVNTLKTYAMCCKIWNHPDILWRAMEEHKEAMDFDIDDPSAPSSCGTGSFSVKNLHKGSSSSSLSRRSSSQSAPGDCESSGGAADSSQSQVFGTQQFASNMSMNFWPSIQSNAFPPNFQFPQPNPFFPISNPSMPNVSYPIHSPSTPTFMYNQQTIQSSPGTYDWATDPSLWGPDYQPGNVEHSGKIMIFLTILEGCVQAGDKVLVFTQSLFTLDLLERILRRLPLPQVRGSDKRKPDNPCSSGSYDDDHSSSSVSKTEPRIPELSLDVGPKTEKCDTDTSTSENNNPQLRPEEPEGKCVISVIKKEVECNELTKSEEFDTKGLQLESSFNEEVKMQEAVNSLQTSRNQTSSTAKRDEEPKKEEADELPEENLRSLHYRLATRSNRSDIPTVWTKNVHYFRLDGSTTASEREKLINNFNNPNNPSKLFLVSTRAGSLGVNLIGANRVVVFDASWNPCHDCQAVCRVYRYGQHKPCYIYRLVSDNTMEKKIYDRQVTKQGMSDRVVDELNPSQQFTRSQVELLMSFEDKDMSTITDDDIEKCQELVQPDPVLGTILDKHKCWITKVPFTHESLLIDRKDYRLTRIEKRLARQRYEQEKRLSLSYQQAHLYQLQQMQLLQQQQLLASGINPCLLSSRTPNILSRNHMSYRPTYTSGMAALDAMRQVEKQSRIRMLQHDMDTARKRCGYDRPDAPDLASDCKITRIVASSAHLQL
ncbi:unnamed protein product [Calicophoron daubneyi]|uniref:Helicase ARIP4 n=1 Tax=Calicophoron daubneyi TaxID=300641 RepID=A0AAV2TH14_CALDB